jgi:hypothetical protein
MYGRRRYDDDDYDYYRAEDARERRRRSCRAPSCRCVSPCDAWYEDREEPEEEEETTSRTRYVVARKARGSVLPGDLVAVTTGFTYEVDGPRTGYFKHERVVGYGPGHGPEKMGKGWGTRRGGFAAHHPEHAAFVAEREARLAAEAKAEQERLKAEAEARRQAREAAHQAICRATTGSVVTYKGQEWTVGARRSKLVMHSNLEYAGGAGDCSVVGVRTLTHTETGETVEYRTSR